MYIHIPTKPKEFKPLSEKKRKIYKRIGFTLIFLVFILIAIPMIKYSASFIIWGAVLFYISLYLIFRAQGKKSNQVGALLLIGLVIFCSFNSLLGFYINDKSLIQNLETTKAIVFKVNTIGSDIGDYKSVGYRFISTEGDTILHFESVSTKSEQQTGDTIFVGYDKTNAKNSKIFENEEHLTEWKNTKLIDKYMLYLPNLNRFYIIVFIAMFVCIYELYKSASKKNIN